MITYKYIKSKDIYVFDKDQIYWALRPEELLEMNQLTDEILAEIAEKAVEKA